MIWNICFALAALVPIVAGVLLLLNKKRGVFAGARLNPFFTMAGALFLSATALFFPMEFDSFSGEGARILQTVLISVHDTIGIFIVDASYEFVAENMNGIGPMLQPVYSSLMAIYFVLAPMFTFGFILSFFKNASAHLLLLLERNRDVYVFSELNERALVLARDLKKNDRRRAIVFCEVFDSEDERSHELINGAKAIGAILFKKDVLGINVSPETKLGALYFFIIGEDPSENVNQSLSLIRDYGNAENSHLYLFSDTVTGELLLSNGKQYKMKIRRVNEPLSLIQRELYDHPTALFDNAVTTPEGEKLISAVIVGLDGCGAEMLKTLTWYCQMDGYKLHIDAFDSSEDAYSALAYQCPEIMSERYNGVSVKGEAYYRVNVHSGISVGTEEFAREISALKQATYVLVSLGDDDLNVETAVALRMFFERMGIKPVIRAVVHSSQLSRYLEGLTNYRGKEYGIELIGDLESSYSESVILHSAIEREALSIHCDGYGGKEADFYAYEYNYRSSIASALHNRVRRALNIPGAGKSEDEMTPAELESIMALEHCRWNAYMRSIGYIFSGSEDPKSRNDLAKMHHNLVCFDKLSEADKNKDRTVGTVDTDEKNG